MYFNKTKIRTEFEIKSPNCKFDGWPWACQNMSKYIQIYQNISENDIKQINISEQGFITSGFREKNNKQAKVKKIECLLEDSQRTDRVNTFLVAIICLMTDNCAFLVTLSPIWQTNVHTLLHYYP